MKTTKIKTKHLSSMKNEISNLASSMKAEITVNQKIKKSTIKLQSHIDTALFRAFL